MSHKAVKSPYVDYKYYEKCFFGKKIPEKSFPGYEMQAEAFVNRITFGRVKRLPKVPDEVKKAICAVAEFIFQEDKKTPGAKSENIDGYSVTYEDAGAGSQETGMYQKAKIFLSDTGLLYRGRSSKYDC